MQGKPIAYGKHVYIDIHITQHNYISNVVQIYNIEVFYSAEGT